MAKTRRFLPEKPNTYPCEQPLPLPEAAHPASSGDTSCSASNVFRFALNVHYAAHSSLGRGEQRKVEAHTRLQGVRFFQTGAFSARQASGNRHSDDPNEQ